MSFRGIPETNAPCIHNKQCEYVCTPKTP